MNNRRAAPAPRPGDRARRKARCIHMRSPRRATKFRFALWALVSFLCLPAHSQVESLYRITDGKFASHVEYHRVDLAPGKELALGDLPGPGKVTYFYYTDDGTLHGVMYAGLVLKVYWDDATEPSIQVPLWNFFGAFGHKTMDYSSAPMAINHYCYISYLPMPFSKRARFVLANDGDETYSQSMAWGIDYEKSPDFAHESSRLHAAWSRSMPAEAPDSVHEILSVTGRGQYIGNFLQVNTNYEQWWGEGDTIFNVDGESITHSPGTEDEYGSTWDFEHTFSYPYSGYIQMEEGKNRMYRWYVMNPVRFQKSLQVRIQDQRIRHGQQVPSKDPSDEFTSVAFWYQEGAHSAPALPSYQERVAARKGAVPPWSR